MASTSDLIFSPNEHSRKASALIDTLKRIARHRYVMTDAAETRSYSVGFRF